MSTDALLIAKAISSIRSDVDVFKDYVFPVAMSFFSSFLGVLSAYWIYTKQERIKKEKENFLKSNNVILKVFETLNVIVALKVNYYKRIDPQPLHRVFLVPPFLSHLQRAQVDIGDFLFIKQVSTANKSLYERIYDFIKFKMMRRERLTPSAEEIGKSWRNLSRLSACVNNYNFIVSVIEERNKILMNIKSRLSSHNKGKDLKISPEMALEIIGGDDMIPLIDLTETFLSMIDYLIHEMDSFLKEFPDIAESNIELSLVGRGAKLTRVINDRPLYIECLKRVSPPDYVLLSTLLRIPLDEVKYKYTFSEWY